MPGISASNRRDGLSNPATRTPKHPTVLSVGQEGEFKLKKDRMFLRMAEGGDHKTRTYQVVGMKPTNPDSAPQNSSSKSSEPSDTP